MQMAGVVVWAGHFKLAIVFICVFSKPNHQLLFALILSSDLNYMSHDGRSYLESSLILSFLQINRYSSSSCFFPYYLGNRINSVGMMNGRSSRNDAAAHLHSTPPQNRLTE
jgi:hypothetical protein